MYFASKRTVNTFKPVSRAVYSSLSSSSTLPLSTSASLSYISLFVADQLQLQIRPHMNIKSRYVGSVCEGVSMQSKTSLVAQRAGESSCPVRAIWSQSEDEDLTMEASLRH